MKLFVRSSVASLILTISAFAQPPGTFDIATFTSPSGWKKQVKEGAVVFTTSSESRGTFAVLTVYRSGDSSGDAKSDFDSDWQEFIARQLGVKTKPDMERARKVEGWDMITGGASFENDMGPSVALLHTFSGYRRSISIAQIFNSRDYLPAMENFLSSLRLKTPEAVVQLPPANDDGAASIVGTWGVSHSDQSAYSVNNAVSGYIAREYTFNADGTYRFISKTFDPFSTKLLFGKETGTYRVSGDLLTITPRTSVLEGWSKKNGSGDRWGARLDSQNRNLETVTYRFTKHYFSGIQKTSLILLADRVTQRDGPFSGGSTFANSWIYSPPCSQCFIEMPGY